MADANPVKMNPVNYNERSALPQHDSSPIKRGVGKEVKKVRCDVCDAKYGYDVDEGDSGCPDCEARIARKKIREEKLARLEAQAKELEAENAEFDAKEKELKERIEKAQAGKKAKAKK